MKIGFTGTQLGMTERQKDALAADLWAMGTEDEADEFHHGDCAGADAEADEIARSFGYLIVIHPPSNPAKRAFRFQDGDVTLPEAPYLDRNKAIVEATDFLFAAPHGPEELRSGTWSTVRYARARGKAHAVLEP